MRRVLPLFILVALLAFPVAAGARVSGTRDTNGMLSIERGRGTVDLQARGAVIAQIRKGKVKVKIYKGRHRRDRQTIIRMRGAGTMRRLSDGTLVYDGKNIRIRIVDQHFRVQIKGVGIHLSAVAIGQVTLQADPNAADPGVFSINAADYQPLPELATTYQLSGS